MLERTPIWGTCGLVEGQRNAYRLLAWNSEKEMKMEVRLRWKYFGIMSSGGMLWF
jgi:hypothetical protein